jgi:hypothetical protein
MEVILLLMKHIDYVEHVVDQNVDCLAGKEFLASCQTTRGNDHSSSVLLRYSMKSRINPIVNRYQSEFECSRSCHLVLKEASVQMLTMICDAFLQKQLVLVPVWYTICNYGAVFFHERLPSCVFVC